MTKEEALQKIEELKKFIEQEENKPTKEERFKEIITGLVTDVRDDTTYFFKDGKIYFELQNNTLWCSIINVWNVFSNEFNMSYNDIQNFINIRMDFHYKMKGVTPSTGKPLTLLATLNELKNQFIKRK